MVQKDSGNVKPEWRKIEKHRFYSPEDKIFCAIFIIASYLHNTCIFIECRLCKRLKVTKEDRDYACQKVTITKCSSIQSDKILVDVIEQPIHQLENNKKTEGFVSVKNHIVEKFTGSKLGDRKNFTEKQSKYADSQCQKWKKFQFKVVIS